MVIYTHLINRPNTDINNETDKRRKKHFISFYKFHKYKFLMMSGKYTNNYDNCMVFLRSNIRSRL